MVGGICKGYRNRRPPATLASMELILPPDAETKLNDLARRTHRGTDELLQEAVDHLVTYNEWLERKVKDSRAAVQRGETASDEQVRELRVGNAHKCGSNGPSEWSRI